MLQYNDEDHNLVERRNRKDLSIRLSQFFDYYLKGAPAAKWITDGVPATVKGIEWGTERVERRRHFDLVGKVDKVDKVDKGLNFESDPNQNAFFSSTSVPHSIPFAIAGTSRP